MSTEQYQPNSIVPKSGIYYCVLCMLSYELAKTKGADPFLIATLYAKESGVDTKTVKKIFAGYNEPIIRKKFKASDKFDECPIHKTATGWGLEQDKDSMQVIAETWLQYYIDGAKGQVDNNKEWAVLRLYDLSLKEPVRALEIVQFINSKNISDDKTRKYIDTIVGGSPLANILYACDDSLWKSILATAANSERLCRQLKEIVKDSVDNERRWQELQRFLAQRR
jgi:hypothetical protein